MTLYRIENDEGRGIYQGGTASDIGVYADDGRQPMPSEWLLVQRCTCADPRDHLRFAFPSLDCLRRWFVDHERATIRHRAPDFQVSEYEVDDEHVRADESQATFARCRARLVTRLEVPA